MTNPSPIMASSPMEYALDEAKKAAQKGEIPVGAMMIHRPSQHILFRGHNLVETLKDPTAHAEMLALRAASHARGTTHLEDCDLYVTLEPCAMCAQAMSLARLGRLFFAAYNPKGGAVEHGVRVFESPSCFWAPEYVGGVMEKKAQELLQNFFQQQRDAK